MFITAFKQRIFSRRYVNKCPVDFRRNFISLDVCNCFKLKRRRRFGSKGTCLLRSQPSADILPRAFSMAETSTEESVPLVSGDKKLDELASTSQQIENSGGPPPDDVKTENGTAHDIPANENGAAVVLVATENIPVEPETLAELETKSKVDEQEEMSKKAPASPTKHSVKPANPTKPGTAPVSKPGGVATSVKKV